MDKNEIRKYVIAGIIIFLGLIYIIRLFFIQVIDSTYKHSAENNSQRAITQYPVRGIIYDRNGVMLVGNEAAYDLMLIPRQIKSFDTIDLCKVLGIKKEDLIRDIKKCKNYSYYRPSIFVKQLSVFTYAVLQEKMYKYPGFFVQPRTLRTYPRKIAPHVMGYIGEVSEATSKSDPYYRSGDYLGISGLEKSYEIALRGTKGVKRFLVDVHNRIQGRYEDGSHDTLAMVGSDLHISIDADLQAYGEELLRNKCGSIVAIEPSTGEILAMVSSPSYDPNLLVGRARSVNYKKLSTDSLKPLFNRAIMSRYSPGSVFKTVQALIALELGVITENTGFPCVKSLVNCHNHTSASNIKLAIQVSCNPYFYKVFQRIVQQGKSHNIFKDSQMGIKQWKELILTFGLGKAFDLDIPGSKSGLIPGVDFYDKWYGKERWAFSTIYSNGIGQGEVEITPIQVANLVAIYANRGYFYTPHFVHNLTFEGKETPMEVKKYMVPVQKKYFEALIEGMYGVVNESGGTARRARLDSIAVCGKTGTVQNSHGEDHSGFAAFAPRENPVIAISVYVENAGFGGTWAAPIAGLMIEKYITGKITNKAEETRILEYKQF